MLFEREKGILRVKLAMPFTEGLFGRPFDEHNMIVCLSIAEKEYSILRHAAPLSGMCLFISQRMNAKLNAPYNSTIPQKSKAFEIPKFKPPSIQNNIKP